MNTTLRSISKYVDLHLLAASLFAALLLLATASAFAQVGSSVVKVDGSSTVFPITEGVAEEFQTAQHGKVRVTVGVSGTGGGFKKFCRGETDVQDASRPITAIEMEECKKTGIKYIELPVAYDATVIVVSTKNTWAKEISVEQLKKMWEPAAQGKVMTWNDVNPAWPKESLKLFGSATVSGTFDYFTEAIMGKSGASRSDYTASDDKNIAISGVVQDRLGLAYVPLAFAEQNKDKVHILPLIGGEKSPKKNTPVIPSKETVESGAYFPLSRPIFIYVNEKSMAQTEVKDFTHFYLKNASSIAASVGYVALPAKVYEMGEGRLTKGKLGTVFGGVPNVGFRIEDLVKKEGTL